MKKVLLSTALVCSVIFSSCSGSSVDEKEQQDKAQEILEETEEDLLKQMEEEEGSDKNGKEKASEAEAYQSNEDPTEGVTEVNIKTR